uniref:Uncharacterized protein n=1 Tax=Lactuca sativa TaxID=4236 RepID=A0A9R1WFG8_LACSA|nr:hypothetical protein LSAT_V11C200089680 [Lactuca sativa]
MNNFADSIYSSSSDDHSSDEDDLVLHTFLGESSNTEKRHRISIVRDCMAAHEFLVRDYFAPDSLYDQSKFKDRFRISRNLFLRIVRDLENNYEFFQLRWDARGKRGFSTLQKCTTTLRQLTYGIVADASDEYLKMSERTGRECDYLFCEYVIELYGNIYLRHPTRMISNSCMSHMKLNIAYHECLSALIVHIGSGQIVSMYGEVNSHVVIMVCRGKAPNMSFVVNEHQYNYGYYLGDGKL